MEVLGSYVCFAQIQFYNIIPGQAGQKRAAFFAKFVAVWAEILRQSDFQSCVK